MAEICPVHGTILYLSEQIDSGNIKEPRIRRISEHILKLLEEISNGHAGSDHLFAIDALVEEYFENSGKNGATSPIASESDLPSSRGFGVSGVQLGEYLKSVLLKEREIFQSHLETGNCASMDCIRLAPSPCQMACPAGIDVPTYLSLIADGRDDEAIEVIRRDNPLPWVCGLVCTRPCEMMCVRGRIDTPVSIKFLKAFAAERAMSHGKYVNPPCKPLNGKKVCVVGAGPAGLSASYYLALMGYQVRVLEALPVPGGMLMVGIPRYRLPREVIDREVAMIESLGVEFCFNTRFGKDITLDSLKKEGFEAFFIAIGAHKAYTLGLEGEERYFGRGVYDAVSFLRRVALGDRKVPGRKVVVIGGGNVAIDAARTSLRLGAESVTIAYRRTRSEMPADIEEVEHAEEEGVEFSFLTIPTEICGDEPLENGEGKLQDKVSSVGEYGANGTRSGNSGANENLAGKVTGLACVRGELVKKEGSDRMYPVPVEGSDYIMDVDAVISAIGQYVDVDEIKDFSGVKWTRRGTIEVRHACMETGEPGVFAAGDAVTGPATVIEAIGGGKRAAEAIDRYFNNMPQPRIPSVPTRYRREIPIEMPASTRMVLKRPEMPMLNIDRRRVTFQQAELGYTENMVREEARRCLRCDICRRCGKCVDVCRDKMGIGALHFGYMDFDHPGESDFRKTAETCITCGACAANCPNGAIVIEERNDERLLKLCGTILNRQKLLYCDNCNAVLGPAKYLDYVESKTAGVAGKVGQGRRLCSSCAREQTAGFNVDSPGNGKGKKLPASFV
ncbi:Glutamate synthase (NADPH) [Desulfamplus magnetovallimortis]|uniref:Glutamate synthase (NADPH) n=1 Tax=Desulfamplus magnetovallimortis TaxID=1246637 RepID=A0A1W1H5H8_9BACT|nr:FAD-dependent oxidoreductase [Desulfamplus magnetovallimortis]SLM27618.1 Glutamate synthase (NADPH) [Desulfamplus magnetovallimortis]